MRKAAVTLVAPERYLATLRINAQQPGITVLVDGEFFGQTPLENIAVEVSPGSHAIEANGEAMVPFSTMVDVAYGEVKDVTVELSRSTAFVGGETPFRHRWWTWAIAGAGVVSTALGGYMNYLHADAVDQLNTKAALGTLSHTDASTLNDSKNHWQRAVFFYGAGGAMVSTFGVLIAVDLL